MIQILHILHLSDGGIKHLYMCQPTSPPTLCDTGGTGWDRGCDWLVVCVDGCDWLVVCVDGCDWLAESVAALSSPGPPCKMFVIKCTVLYLRGICTFNQLSVSQKGNSFHHSKSSYKLFKNTHWSCNFITNRKHYNDIKYTRYMYFLGIAWTLKCDYHLSLIAKKCDYGTNTHRQTPGNVILVSWSS